MDVVIFLPYALLFLFLKIFKKDFRIFTVANILTLFIQLTVIVLIYQTPFYLDPLALLVPLAGAIIFYPVSRFVVAPALKLIWKPFSGLRPRYSYPVMFMAASGVLLYVTGYIIGGHPPVFLFIVLAPALPLVYVFSEAVRFFNPVGGGHFADLSFLICTVLTYGLLGFVAGLVAEWRRKKREV